jgi:glycosyltransferase involved in cell wall biosynthesis
MLFVTTIDKTIEMFLFPYAEHLAARGWRVDAMTQVRGDGHSLDPYFESVWPLRWSRNPLDARTLFRAPRAIRALVRAGRYDIVHVHTPVAAFVTRFALRREQRAGQVKIVYTAHGFHFHDGERRIKNAIYALLERLAGRWTDHLIVINEEDRDAALRLDLVDPARLSWLPGIGIDTQVFCREGLSETAIAQRRRGLLGDRQGPVYLIVAELHPRKRHADALHGFTLLGDPESVLALAGEGSLEPELRRRARALGIDGQVRFLGHRPDVPVLVAASDALVLTSEREGLPRCVLEAMAIGTPVIATAVRGTRELLADDCGVLVPVGEPRALAEAMRSLIDQPDVARTRADRARQRVREDYGLDQLLAAHDQLYERLVNDGRTGALALSGSFAATPGV